MKFKEQLKEGKATNFDYRLDKETALFLLKHNLLDEKKVNVMCKEYGHANESDDEEEGVTAEDWVGVTSEDYEDLLDDDYQTFELWLE